MKYLDDNRRKLQGQQPGQTVQKQPLQPNPETLAPAQTTAAAPAPLEKQNIVQQIMKKQNQTVTQAPAQTQTQTTAPSAAVQAQQLLNQQPGAYQSKWGSTIEDVLEQLLNPKEFTYDPNTDPLYLQLRDQYARNGKLAMEDTMGYAAQLTGGYGNSHAQMLGQQTYQGYLQNVNDMVPELRQQARADYDAQNDALLQKLSLLMDQDSQDYSRYLDEINRQYQLERDALSDQRYDQEWQYQQDRDALSDKRYEEELAYGREQDSYNRQQDAYDRLLEMIISTGYQPTAEELAAAGMTEAQAKAWRNYYTASTAGSSSGGSGGSWRSSGSGDDNSLSDDKGSSAGQHSVPTREELGDPFKKEDYTTVYANCAVWAGNGAPASELAAYIKGALDDGNITKEQYDKLMAKFGNLVDTGNKGSSGSGRGGGPGIKDRYNAIN